MFNRLMAWVCGLIGVFSLLDAFSAHPVRGTLWGVLFGFGGALLLAKLADRDRRKAADAKVAMIEAEENYRDAIKHRNQLIREGRDAGIITPPNLHRAETARQKPVAIKGTPIVTRGATVIFSVGGLILLAFVVATVIALVVHYALMM